MRHYLLYKFDKGSSAAAACYNNQIYEEDADWGDWQEHMSPLISKISRQRQKLQWLITFKTSINGFKGGSGPSYIRNNSHSIVIRISGNIVGTQNNSWKTTIGTWVHEVRSGFHTSFLWSRRESIFLLSRNKIESFLERIVTKDEKWVLYRNIKS